MHRYLCLFILRSFQGIDCLQGDFRSNVPDGGRNAVTWGVFPGQEIAQSTIIEKNSFLSWKVPLFEVISMILKRILTNLL